MQMLRIAIALLAPLAAAVPVAAQTADVSPSSAPRVTSWRVETGLGWFGLRDVARTNPVDASLTTWQGSGVVVEAQYSRSRGSRLHRFDVTLTLTGDFAYRSPLSTSGALNDDRHRALDGRYEYRRYPMTNLGLRGLEVGIGVQAIGTVASMSRHVPLNLVTEYSTASVGPGLVVAARLQRWSKVTGEVAWTNGRLITRLNGRDGDAFAANSSQWGGIGLAELAVAADVRVSQRTTLAVTWRRSRGGLDSNHQHWTTSQGSLIAGVTYAK